ncbi:unnamed protein product, partial [Musa banksii]
FLPQPSPVSYPRLPSSCRLVSRRRSLLPCVLSAPFPLSPTTVKPVSAAISTDQEELKETESQVREEVYWILRWKSSGFSRGVSKYRGVARCMMVRAAMT